jgi:hypothetical protein
MKKRKPESKFEILPFEEVYGYSVAVSINDVHTNKSKIINWLDVRSKNIEDNRDVYMKLGITSEGFHMSLTSDVNHENSLMFMRINHVVALQIKQACDYYIKCYDEHRLQNDITIYEHIDLLNR